MTLNNYKTERYTNLQDEIETFPPKTTLVDILICIGIGAVIALVITWRIYS